MCSCNTNCQEEGCFQRMLVRMDNVVAAIVFKPEADQEIAQWCDVSSEHVGNSDQQIVDSVLVHSEDVHSLLHVLVSSNSVGNLEALVGTPVRHSTKREHEGEQERRIGGLHVLDLLQANRFTDSVRSVDFSSQKKFAHQSPSKVVVSQKLQHSIRWCHIWIHHFLWIFPSCPQLLKEVGHQSRVVNGLLLIRVEQVSVVIAFIVLSALFCVSASNFMRCSCSFNSASVIPQIQVLLEIGEHQC